MDASLRMQAVKRMKEHFEENNVFTAERLVDEVIKELELPFTPEMREELTALAHEVHAEIQDEGFDYDHVADQSFPASDPPPIP